MSSRKACMFRFVMKQAACVSLMLLLGSTQVLSEIPPDRRANRIYDENRSLGGFVVNVESSGLIELEDGTKFYLWGLHRLNVDEVTELLISRRVHCRHVVDESQYPAYDCDVQSRRINGQRSYSNMSLYHWLVDFEFAEHQCSARDFPGDGVKAISHITGYYYHCDNETPIRQIPVE